MRRVLLIIFIILGGILGCTVGKMAAGVSFLKWLSAGGSFGFANPLVLDLSFLKITFGIWCNINVGGILFMIIFALISSQVLKWIRI